MREEDKKAFVEEYLELCRKYRWCISPLWGTKSILCPFDNEEEINIKELVE